MINQDHAATPLHERVALGVDEAATLLGLSAVTVRRLVRDGLLRRVPHTNRVLIARRELDRFVCQNLDGAA